MLFTKKNNLPTEPLSRKGNLGSVNVPVVELSHAVVKGLHAVKGLGVLETFIM